MKKYIYNHDSGEYSAYTGLSRDESEIFENLRKVTEPGAFVYAPTTSGEIILFSYSQGNGQYRVDGYKGELNDVGSNSAAYIGNVRVEKPYEQDVRGALPGRVSFVADGVDAVRMANIVQYLIFGEQSKEIVVLGRDIVNRMRDYLSYLNLLFPPEYCKRIGFCINEYLKHSIEDNFLPSDEKPLVRIYALDCQNNFANSYEVDLDVVAQEGEADSIGAKALRYLINRGVSQSNFNSICDATQAAFSRDGKVDLNEYTRLLVSEAYRSSNSLEYAEAIVGYGFRNASEKELFKKCVSHCLNSGSSAQKDVAVAQTLRLLGDDLDEDMTERLFEYIVSKQSISNDERDFISKSIIEQLTKNSDGESKSLLTLYLDAYNPTLSWNAKYDFVTKLVARLIESGKVGAAYEVCHVISNRFSEDRLRNAMEDISSEFMFSTVQNLPDKVKSSICAALLKNDCGVEGGKPHTRARAFLKSVQEESLLHDVLTVRGYIKTIFGKTLPSDFIFGDRECERTIRSLIDKEDLKRMMEMYERWSSPLADYHELKIEFLYAILDLEKFGDLADDEDFYEKYKDFLDHCEDKWFNSIANSNKAKGNRSKTLGECLQECRDFIAEKENEDRARQSIEDYCNDFWRKLYEYMSKKDKKKAKKNRADAEGYDYTNTIGKYGECKVSQLQFNGTKPYRYDIAYGLFSGLIACIIMFIPAICLAGITGERSLSAVATYFSSYFYAAIVAPVVTMAVYAITYATVCRRNGLTTFKLTALCTYIPWIACGLGYVLSYIYLT